MSEAPQSPLTPRDRALLSALEGLRKNLLDLTLRNRLLNFRPSKVRGIAVVGEDGQQVFRRLVTDGRVMRFAGVPDAPDPLREIEVSAAATSDALTDEILGTQYPESKLQDRLLRTWSDSRTVIEEQGINTLFLAIGMLDWVEMPNSERVLRAPLILVPVALERGERGRFRLKWTGEELGGNLSLSAKMKDEFEVALPEVAEADDLDVGAYLAAVEHAIAGRPRFVVERNAIVVDLFSYAKYLMFRDLDPARWPEGRKPHQHLVVGGLLGDGIGRDQPPAPDPTPLDDHRRPENAFEVCDADSSQTLVLIDVSAGKQMVVEGPPGTGKSQTIANIIAEAVASDRTVLFVAEKMAALEVVKRRLDEYRIGDACLELHSHKTRKREFLKELGRTLDLDRLQIHGAAEHAAQLLEARGKLNDYARELHRVVEPTGWTPYEAQGELARIGTAGEIPPRGATDELTGLTRERFEACRRAIRDLQSKIREIGLPNAHPFFGCRPEDFLPGDVPTLLTELQSALEATKQLREAAAALAELLKVDPPATCGDALSLVIAAELIAKAPALVSSMSVADPRWQSGAPKALAVLRSGRRREEIRKQLGPVVRDDVWGQSVEELIEDLGRSGAGWGRVLKPSFYRVRGRLKAICRGALPEQFAERQDLALRIREEEECSKRVRAEDVSMGDVCGKAWKGLESDFGPMLAAGTWVAEFHAAIAERKIPTGVLRFFGAEPFAAALRPAAAGVEAQYGRWALAVAAVVKRLRPSSQSWGLSADPVGIVVAKAELASIEEWLANGSKVPQRVLEIIAFNRLRDAAVALNLESFCQIADSWDGAGGRLEESLLLTWCELLVRIATRERPALAGFERVSHEHLVAQYQRLDRGMIDVNRDRVRTRHRMNLPLAVGAGATGLLREQINLQRRHKPIRKLIQDCSEPIQRLKPVVMMSPFSVAMFLPPEGPKFDLVVFDEASQVRPEDAIGAILRASQVVVVGDSNQLPPTNFFENALAADDADGDDEDAAVQHVPAGDMESILSLMRARGADVRDLRWHYRSRHSSLIRVSGHAFYPALEVFPSPEETSANVGLRLHHMPETVYGRGTSKTNPEEAKAVAKAIQEHVRSAPHLTLGVAAFSVSQQMAILRQLELLQRDDAAVDAFAAAHPTEPLFVKNLENVQGDERDVIFISVGYGRDANRQMTLNFGPLNQEGGERRLNVLISRARLRCEVFSNFTADDLPLPADAPKGVRLLKTFLRFAATGDIEVPTASGRPPDSPFEESVAAFLRGEGHTVEHQVGSAGYFVDLAVLDPDRPGRYLLGIECDGAKYHSARSARDRDRLREQVLRSKGWDIHRIWSTSWYRENATERRRVVSAIADASSLPDHSTAPPMVATPRSVAGTGDVRVTSVAAPTPSRRLTVPYGTAQVHLNLRGRNLHEVWVGELADVIAKVVDVESPVHSEEVLRRIRGAANVQRAGSRIRDAFEKAKRHAANAAKLKFRGDFLWAPAMVVSPVRDRSGVPDAARSFDFIAPEEIQELVVGVVANAFRIKPDELATEVARLFGFERVTAEMRSRIDREVGALLGQGRLAREGDQVRVPVASDEWAPRGRDDQ